MPDLLGRGVVVHHYPVAAQLLGRGSRMGELPSGTVTFLLTDIEGSTRLWEAHSVEMAQALVRHDEILATAVVRADGLLLKTRGEGDSTFSVFARATDAINATVAFQQTLAAE